MAPASPGAAGACAVETGDAVLGAVTAQLQPKAALAQAGRASQAHSSGSCRGRCCCWPWRRGGRRRAALCGGPVPAARAAGGHGARVRAAPSPHSNMQLTVKLYPAARPARGHWSVAGDTQDSAVLSAHGISETPLSLEHGVPTAVTGMRLGWVSAMVLRRTFADCRCCVCMQVGVAR